MTVPLHFSPLASLIRPTGFFTVSSTSHLVSLRPVPSRRDRPLADRTGGETRGEMWEVTAGGLSLPFPFRSSHSSLVAERNDHRE